MLLKTLLREEQTLFVIGGAIIAPFFNPEIWLILMKFWLNFAKMDLSLSKF